MLTTVLHTSADLDAAGFSRSEVRRRLRPDGDLIALARGVYASRTAWESLDGGSQHVVRARAVLRVTAHDAVLSHGTAALTHRLATLHASTRLVHLTRPGLGTGKRRTTHQVHGCVLDENEIATLDGVRVTTPARTVADVTRSDGWLPGLVVADQALRAGTTREDLRRALDRQQGLPGAACFARLARAADAGSENPGETLARAAVLEALVGLGIEDPLETQFLVESGGRTAYADLRLGRLLIEFDGRWKYARDRSFGDGAPPSEVLWREKRREEWLRELGFHVVRLCWDDVWGPQRAATVARLREAVVRRSGLV